MSGQVLLSPRVSKTVPDPVRIMRFAADFFVLMGLVVLLFLNPLTILVIYTGELHGVRSCRLGSALRPVVAIVWNILCLKPTSALPLTLDTATDKPRTDRTPNFAMKLAITFD